MSYRISSEQSQSFEDDGFLVLRGVLSQSETKDLQRWAQEVHDWPVLPESPWMPYEVVQNPELQKAVTYTRIRRSTPAANESSAELKTMRITMKASMVSYAARSCLGYLNNYRASR